MLVECWQLLSNVKWLRNSSSDTIVVIAGGSANLRRMAGVFSSASGQGWTVVPCLSPLLRVLGPRSCFFLANDASVPTLSKWSLVDQPQWVGQLRGTEHEGLSP